MNTLSLLFIGSLGAPEIIIIALVVLLLFGGKKIPELMRGIGKGVRSFKEGINGIEKDIKDNTDVEANAKSDPEERAELMPTYDEPTNESIAQNLAAILELDAEDVLKRLAKTNSWSEVIKTQVESEQADQVRSYAKNNGLSAGIYVLPSSKRYYPYSSLASQIIGWVNYNDGNRGAYGLEAMYNDVLSGQTGRIVTAKDGTGKQLLYRYEDYEDAVDGMDLHLTLDATIQYYCERVLSEGIQKYEVQNGGFAIAMDPNTGAILAWANSPTYDLNNPSAVTDPDTLAPRASSFSRRRLI